MPPLKPYVIREATADVPSDQKLESLYDRVYVDGGFTDPLVAKEMFAAAAIRNRGKLFVALESKVLTPIGAAIMVRPGNPSCRLAGAAESELHLLAVLNDYRGIGIGGDLIVAVMQAAREEGSTRMWLWSQPSMRSAHRLYARAGWRREKARDFHHNDREFWVFVTDF